jgi:hypothetical protein
VLADKRLARDGGQVDALLLMLLVTMYASEKSAMSVDAAARDLRIDTVSATIFGVGRFSPLDFSVAGQI